jgi:ferredoxin
VSELQIAIDRGACMGAGECVFRAPHTFAFDTEGRSVVIGSGADDGEAVLDAARGCPNFAISVTRDGKPL